MTKHDPVTKHDPIYWVLMDDNNVRPGSRDEWLEQVESSRKIVRQTRIDPYMVVSTVFLGLDFVSRTGSPELFETMVFDDLNEYPETTRRYSTWAGSLRGHQQIVQTARSTLPKGGRKAREA